MGDEWSVYCPGLGHHSPPLRNVFWCVNLDTKGTLAVGGGRGDVWTWMETDRKGRGATGDPNLKISGQWLYEHKQF